MAARPGRAFLQIEYLGAITIVKFRRRQLLDVGMIEDVGDELFQLMQEEKRHRLLVNLSNIDRLSTAMVGKFVAVHRKAQAEGGWMAFCNVPADIHQVFELLRLTDVFALYEDEQLALEALRAK